MIHNRILKPEEVKLRDEGLLAADDYIWTNSEQTHLTRRRLLNKQYPELQNLPSYDIREAYFCCATIALQLFIAYYISTINISWKYLLLITYAISGTLNHSHFAALHELGHYLMLPETWQNKLLGMMVNIPMGIPIALTFPKYHSDHHTYFGVVGIDPDIPSPLEAKLVQTTFTKILFLCCNPVLYLLRPLFIKPKKVTFPEIISIAIILTTNTWILRTWGFKSLLYLIGGSLFGFSFHPFVGHLISEHYHFPWGVPLQETYSYYGISNYLTYNVGYHVEHHDNHTVPGYHLPTMKKTAPEFYNIVATKSWPLTLLQFIFTDVVTPYSRVVRKSMKGGDPDPPHKVHVKNPNDIEFINPYLKRTKEAKNEASNEKKD